MTARQSEIVRGWVNYAGKSGKKVLGVNGLEKNVGITVAGIY